MSRMPFFRFAAPLIAAAMFTPLMAKDIGILMDRSKSVEQENRDEAVELINGLLAGNINPQIRGKWKIKDDVMPAEDDPGQRELRKQELENITKLIEGQPGKGLANDRFRLFLGSFGNLDTVKNLESEAWSEVTGPTGERITSWAKTVAPTDNETHFELARAVAASRLVGAREFYYFVISDGVEDLVNWPVSSYLEMAKIKDPQALERGDFRDLEKARVLEANNLKRIGGGTLKIGGKTYPGYDVAERGRLAAFKKNFAERLLCRITLKGPELQAFFAKYPEKKVPVSVSIYSARPKGSVTLRFAVPADSQAGQPHPVSRSADGIAWNLDVPAGERPEDYTQELFVRSSSGAEMGSKVVTGKEGPLLQWFPDLQNGDYELRLVASRKGGAPVVTSAFVHVKRDAPKLAFLGQFAEAGAKQDARVFDPRRDRDILGYKVDWTWTSGDEADPGPPERLERTLSFVDDQDSTRKLESVVKLTPSQKSSTLGALLMGDSASEEALPLGGTYRVRLTAKWADGTSATPAEAWFVLPPPNLKILGKAPESEGQPRIVEKGDSIKLGNWMDSWTKYRFSYELSVTRKEGDDWVPLEGSSGDWPLQLEETDDGQPSIRVKSSFPGTLRYSVSFGPDDDAKRELVECPEAAGFVEAQGFPLMPWLLGGVGLLTIVFFVWNLLRRR